MKFSDRLHFNEIALLMPDSTPTLSPQGGAWLRDHLSNRFGLSATGNGSFTALQDQVGWLQNMEKRDLVPGMSVGPGRFLSRLAKYMAKLGVNLNSEEKEYIGNELSRHWIGGKELYFDIASQVDWQIGEMGENPNTNCWLGARLDRFNAKMLDGEAAAVRLFRRLTDDEVGTPQLRLGPPKKSGRSVWYDHFAGVGRAWMILNVPQPDTAIIFNTYGPLQTPQLAAALTRALNLSQYYEIKPVYIGGELTINVNADGVPSGYLIGNLIANQPRPAFYDNRRWASARLRCCECREQMTEDEMWRSPSTGSPMCRNCLEEYFVQEHDSGQWIDPESAVYVITRNEGHIWLSPRRLDRVRRCDNCYGLFYGIHSTAPSSINLTGRYCFECTDRMRIEDEYDIFNQPSIAFADLPPIWPGELEELLGQLARIAPQPPQPGRYYSSLSGAINAFGNSLNLAATTISSMSSNTSGITFSVLDDAAAVPGRRTPSTLFRPMRTLNLDALELDDEMEDDDGEEYIEYDDFDEDDT